MIRCAHQLWSGFPIKWGMTIAGTGDQVENDNIGEGARLNI